MNRLKIVEDLIEIEKKLPIGWSLDFNCSKNRISVSLWNKGLEHGNVYVCTIESDEFSYEKVIMDRLQIELLSYKDGIKKKKKMLLEQLQELED
jgi:hypothetical protein